MRAGRLVWDAVYTVPRPNASKQERKRIREVTEEQIQRTNANTAQRKLEQLIACNFADNDLVLTATYRDEDLPESADVTRKHLGKVFSQMRAYRKARGLPDLKYIYVLEGRHGDHRPHAHIIINAIGGDLEPRFERRHALTVRIIRLDGIIASTTAALHDMIAYAD